MAQDEPYVKSWIAELESALKEDNVDSEDGVEKDLESKDVLANAWKDTFVDEFKTYNFDEIFDLPEQNLIRQDCQQIVAKLGNDDEEKVSVVSDLETILTHHRKTSGVRYSSNNGWLDLLLPLIALKLPRSDTYHLFKSIASKYVPRHSCFYHLFRLVLLYHDPTLCSFLDTKRITPEQYSSVWFQSLFSATCDLPVTTHMWHMIFLQQEPFFLLFLGVVMVINMREQILKLNDSSKEQIVSVLSVAPSALKKTDINDFFSLAQDYDDRTPCSFKEDLERCLFGGGSNPEVIKSITQALCLPVNVSELVDSLHAPPDLSGGGVRFFLVDCRPADQYNAGHMPTAFHLDCNLMLQAGDVYKMAVQGLLSAQRQALLAGSSAAGEHLCFIGCGYLEQDQYTHMIVASFLRDSHHYVSILNGGYHALHDYFAYYNFDELVDHNPSACAVCVQHEANKLSGASSNVPSRTGGENVPRSSVVVGGGVSSTQSSSEDIFGKIGAVVKSKSVKVKEKLLEYIVNPGASENTERHVRPNDRKGKRYRNMAPVFSVDDDQDIQDDTSWNGDEDDGESQYETVSPSAWREQNGVIASFSCKELKMNGEVFDSDLLISKTHIYVLRPTGTKDKAMLVVRKPLSAIVKITRRKKTPQMITFRYGATIGDSPVINDMDRFLIPKATEAAEIVSQQICDQFKTMHAMQQNSVVENQNE